MAILPSVNTAEEIKSEQIKSPAEFTNEAALNLVVQNAEKADSWLNTRQWPMMWREADVLYNAPRTLQPWEGTTVTRANVSRFIVAKHVNSIMPQIMNGLFWDDPPFILRPRPGTAEETIREKEALFSAVLDMMDFHQNVQRGLFSDVLFGTAIWKWGWISEVKKQLRYKRKSSPPEVALPMGGSVTIPTEESDEFEPEMIEKSIERPFFEAVDIRHLLVDPGCRVGDIRQAKWVIHREYMTFEELNALREIDGYDIPSEEYLKSLFFPPKEMAEMPGTAEQSSAQTILNHAAPRYMNNSADPTQGPLEVLEYVDNDKIVVVVQKKLVIKNQRNEFGCINYLSCNWWDVSDAFYGIGVGRIVGQDQRVNQGVTNAALDILSLAVNPQYVRSRGANVPTQQIRSRLGGIIDVDGEVNKAFMLMEQPKVPPEVWIAIQNAESQAESATGATETLVQGNLPQGGRSSITRTATGAGAFANASASRLQGPLETFIRQVFEPWLYQMDELITQRMPIQNIKDILGEELGTDYKADMEKFLNARVEYEVLAGTHLAARRAMAQSLPVWEQMLSSPALLQSLQQTGYTVDWHEFTEMMWEASEWRNGRDVIRKLNPEEQQAMQQQQQQQSKLAEQMALQQQKAGIQSQQIDQKAQTSLAKDLMLQSFERAGGEILRKDTREASGPAQ